MRLSAILFVVVVAGCSRASDDPFAGAPRGSAAPAASEPTVTVTPPANARAGADAVARVAVLPPAGFHVNSSYPVKLELEPADGVAIAKATLQPGDDGVELDETHLAMAIHVTPTAGTHAVTGKLSVGFCGERSCITKHVPVTLAIAAR